MTENLLQLPKSATNRRLPEFLLSHHRSRSGSRSRSVTGNTLRRGRKRKENCLFLFFGAKNKSAFSEIGKFFRSTKIFVSMPPPKKEIFKKGINMCHLFSLFFSSSFCNSCDVTLFVCLFVCYRELARTSAPALMCPPPTCAASTYPPPPRGSPQHHVSWLPQSPIYSRPVFLVALLSLLFSLVFFSCPLNILSSLTATPPLHD